MLESQLKEANEAKETAQKQIEEKEKTLERLDRERSEAYRRQIVCRTCTRIYLDPIDLPCSNTICKSHFEDFNKSKCSFCLQHHKMSLEIFIKSNQSLSEILQMNLHLSEKEKQIKIEIEKLLETNKSLTEELKLNEAQSDALCYDHFAKIENSIDLQREELKKKIDELSFDLIEQVKQSKSKFEDDLKSNALKPVLNMDEIYDIESDFDQEMRKVEFPLENLKNIENSLKANLTSLNGKLVAIKALSDKIESCKFVIKKIDFDTKIYGEIIF